MNQPNKSQGQCPKTRCGCASAAQNANARCACGETCSCQPVCGCDGCGCSKAK